MRHALSCLAVVLTLPLLGCGGDMGLRDDHHNEAAEYREVAAATRAVLTKHFGRVHVERHTADGGLFVASKISTDGLTQYRLKVTARVVRTEDDHLAPEVRVLQQVDMAVVEPDKRSMAQPQHRWRAIGFQHDMEAQLINEIYEQLGHKTFDATHFRNPLPKPEAAPPSDPSAY